jgi:hypothetical protein
MSNAISGASNDSLVSPADQWLDGHLAKIKTTIMSDAKKLASDSNVTEEMAVAEAARSYAPGNPISSLKPIPFWSRIGESITGVTLASVLLAIVFGCLAALNKENSERWLDVVKLFAGAIVGSVGATAVASSRARQT